MRKQSYESRSKLVKIYALLFVCINVVLSNLHFVYAGGGGTMTINNYARAKELNGEVQYTDSDTVKAVQEALSSENYSCTIDGKYGPNTAEQIKLYEEANDLEADGIITDRLLKSLNIEVSEEARTNAEKASYKSSYSWSEFARNPDDYYGVKAKFSGRIIQDDGDASTFGTHWARLAVDDNYDAVFYITYDASGIDGRILENDYVTVYGEGTGYKQYITVIGTEVSIPSLSVKYIELH